MDLNPFLVDGVDDAQKTLFLGLLQTLSEEKGHILLCDRRGAEGVIAIAIGLVLKWKLEPNLEQVWFFSIIIIIIFRFRLLVL